MDATNPKVFDEFHIKVMVPEGLSATQTREVREWVAYNIRCLTEDWNDTAPVEDVEVRVSTK